MPPKVIKETGPVKIETFLKRIRDLCRNNNLNVWNKLSIPDLIYQDLLFIYHIPRLQREKILTLDLEFIMDGIVDNKITEEMIENTSFSWFNALLSFKTDMDRSAIFKNVWSQLQVSEVKELFDGREFSMIPIEKDTKKSENYYKLMNAIIEYMASITLESYESNAGYTYFKKGLNKGTAQTFGQFYTPESVIQSVVNEVKPLSTESVLDPSCGSCSFIQGAAKYIKDHEKLDNSTTFRNLYGIEVERTIYTEGIMNIFINFGILPDMKKNIIEEDAYTELLTKDTQYDVIVANPPFGADASTFSEFYYETTTETIETSGKKKTKMVRGENSKLKYKIPYPNTKESALLFWQIIVQKLKPGGRAGVVMSATLLNDGNADVMKWFLETCSLEKIIINPAGTFKDQGTSIETFSFIYTKGTPTTNVKIVKLGAEDISVKELTLEQIRDAGWKIKIKEDEAKKVYTGKFELVKLGDILKDISTNKNIPSSERKDGDYRFFTCSRESSTHNQFYYDGTYIIQGSRGSTINESIYITENEKFAIGTSMFISEIIDTEKVNIKYIYYSLKLNTSNLNKFIHTTAIPMISKTNYYCIRKRITIEYKL
jgi:type I restriction enzyme M protein